MLVCPLSCHDCIPHAFAAITHSVLSFVCGFSMLFIRLFYRDIGDEAEGLACPVTQISIANQF